ncbi:MAG: N-acetylmuramoyl-L-alanine amidase [Chloroflexota bacterium]|nr:N-acetylmuramoyl-L-alanine amidase [Chloroflexota bacterium]
MARRTSSRKSPVYEEGTDAVPIASRLVVIISCIAATIATIQGIWGAELAEVAPEITLSPALSANPPANQLPSLDQSADQPVDQAVDQAADQPIDPPAAPLIAAPRIGIVAGHWGSDTGAMCPDGLTEVEINLDVAQRVVYILQALGYQADLLAEYDPRLEGYQADALLSIHADSCKVFSNATPPASGFKVASVEDSLVPEAEERLVTCLAQCYAARTGMYFHANSITYDMIYYHSFYEIDDQTPGAIIEIGFMQNDRTMLTQQTDLVAQGIVDGIVCFIESE